MDRGKFILSIGLVQDDKNILDVPIAATGSASEKIYTKRPSSTKLHTWFGQVLATSIESINGEPIAAPFNSSKDQDAIPPLVRAIPFLDVGNLLIQIQRECWEKVIKGQKLQCSKCGAHLVADIDLGNIDIPVSETAILEQVVKLSKTYETVAEIEQMKQFEGYQFNRMKFRVATLGDAIKHEKIVKDELKFWQNIAFDTLLELYYEDEETGKIVTVPEEYKNRRGKVMFDRDFDTIALKEIRASLQKDLPSAKYYYEEDCPECGEPTPFFANVTNFFTV